MLTVFNDLEGKLIATSLIVDLKSLSLHQRVEAKLYDRKGTLFFMQLLTIFCESADSSNTSR